MARDNFGLTISTKKTEVMHQLVPGKPYFEPNITIKGQRLKVGRKVHLPRQHPKSIVMDDKVNTRLAKVNAAFDQFNRNVWNRRGISETTKIKVYWVVFRTTLLPIDNLITASKEAKPLSHNLF